MRNAILICVRPVASAVKERNTTEEQLDITEQRLCEVRHFMRLGRSLEREKATVMPKTACGDKIENNEHPEEVPKGGDDDFHRETESGQQVRVPVTRVQNRKIDIYARDDRKNALCGMFSYIHDMDIVIECLVPLMVDVSGMTKIMNSVLCVDEIRTLLDRIRDDFYSLRNSNNIKLLEKYADSGKKSSTIYVCVIYMLTVAFLLMPLLQPLIFQIANVTRPMLHRVEYYVDMDKYYFPILIHGYFTAIICVTSIVATDAIFVIFMRHACGLFIVTGSRIEQAIQEVYLTGDVNPPIIKDTAYRNMIQCVHDHRAAIRFVNLIEIVYSKHFLFHAGLNMIAMSVTGVGVCASCIIMLIAIAVTKSNDLSELFRLVTMTCALLFHLCFECINAQRLIDYSGYLHTNLYVFHALAKCEQALICNCRINLNWYNASPRTKKLVLFMMMRTQPPCVLTAGGMFVLCMETFATVR
ncbi:hypothetical protein ALC60_09207 [Trachymyrmex zeteki]|uniref:Odorant receptor n=1 Tax=Mycetomoellerius zeteki TaxID=64791 RepID=A0A151WUR9_9HYME|nr:hypothetical protein ALC60_09207 [Trachymyrmex zeteki]